MPPQAPLNSGFGPATTAAEVVAGRDLSGKVAIVTGGYAGIGLETARALSPRLVQVSSSQHATWTEPGRP